MANITKVNYYRGWISSLNQYAYSWGSQEPNYAVVSGTSYPLVSGSVVIVDSVEEQVVEALIIEENIKTGGHYKAQGFLVDASVSGWNSIDLSWTYPISLLSSEWMVGPQHEGDKIKVEVTPNTVIGNVTSGSVSGTSQFEVSLSTVQNTFLGANLILTDDLTGYLSSTSGSTYNSLGNVSNIDSTNLLITVDNPLTRDFNLAAPSYILQTIVLLDDLDIVVKGPYSIGESKIGGSHIKPGYILRLSYFNADGVPKKFSGVVEFLY